MRIYLYKNKADYNQVDKTDYLSDAFAIDGNFRDVASINAPIINIKYARGITSTLQDDDGNGIVDSTDTQVAYQMNVENLFEYNYLYIPDLHRYYFIENISASTNNVYSISCSVDVLMSFRDEILSLDAYIDRNEFDYNPDTFDSEYILSEDVDISRKEVANEVLNGDWCFVATDMIK